MLQISAARVGSVRLETSWTEGETHEAGGGKRAELMADH